MERGLTITLQLAAIVISLVAVVTFAKPHVKPNSVFAARILKNMNPEIEPCDDFYSFACGGFENYTMFPSGQSNVNVFSIIHDKLLKRLKATFKEQSPPNELKAFTLAKNLYKSCRNKNAIEEAGLEPLRKILRKLGGWPVIEGNNWNEEQFHWTKIVHKLRQLGYSFEYFIGFEIDVNPKNSRMHIISFDQATLSLSREYLAKGLEDKVVKAYFDYMVNVAVLLGADKQKAAQELAESLEFEIKLAKISVPEEERRDPTVIYNPIILRELQQQHPTLNWTNYINELLPPSARLRHDLKTVIVRVPSFIKDLMELLKTTPKRVQANYAVWRSVGDSVQYLTDEMRELQLNYEKVLYGKMQGESRWKECISIVAGSLSISTGAIYVRKHFKEEAKETVIEMVADIKQEFTKILKQDDWMDIRTRSRAIEKVAAMSSHIAYPDELLDDKKLEEFYAALELSPDDFFGNMRNVSLFGINYSLEKLRKPFDKNEWISHGHAAIVNAFYSQVENSIQFPAGILQGAFFSNDRPRYMNYGGIGYVIGHEITHGFDDQGRNYDKNGNMIEWWAAATKEKYLKKAECIIHQYGNYTEPSVGLKLNGINTQGENIADNGGMKAAYRAYSEWAKMNDPEPNLPRLRYTPQQMFWISAANNQCNKYRMEELKLRIATDLHSPGRFRVLGPFSNMPEFAADFNCPVGSPMNPEKKCSVW